MRLLHVVSTLDRGGIAASLRQLLPVLVEDHSFAVEIAILYGDSQYQAAMSQEGVHFHFLQMTSKYEGRAVFRLARLFRSGRFQVVHAHGWPAVLLVALASLLAGEPGYILTEHSVTNRRRRWRLKLLDRFIYSRFQQVIAVSQAAADALVAWLPETAGRISLIYNGLEPAQFERSGEVRGRVRRELVIADSAPVILFAGGWQHHKGADILLNALGWLQDGGYAGQPPITLIAGVGQPRADIVELASRLDGRVQFLGFRSDLSDLMAAADLFVLASRWEGCPMAVLEAMAMGLPIIASRVGGVPELIEDGKSGLLLPAEDAPALGRGIAHLLNNQGLACQLGQAARRRVENCFTVGQGARALAAVYGAVG